MDGLKLLVVEDDPLFGGAIVEALEDAGAATRLATCAGRERYRKRAAD